MQPDTKQRRVLFTTDAKLAIRRKPAATMATADQKPEQPAAAEQITLTGYAMVWNALSDDRGGYHVKLLPGSAKFADTVHALYHHDYRAVLGTTANGSLRLSSDNVGVKVEIDLPATTVAADVAKLVEGGYVAGMSFSMLWQDIEYDVRDADTDDELMEVKSFTCDEVTITPIPSFTETVIGLKDGDDAPAESSTEPVQASARIEQTIRLERLRLAALEI